MPPLPSSTEVSPRKARIGPRIRLGPQSSAGLVAMILLALIFLPAQGIFGQVGAQVRRDASDLRDRGTIGFFMGKTSARQIWVGPLGTEKLGGISFGVFMDVSTPLPPLSIRAEAGYVGRGSVVWDEIEDPGRESEARFRSHYLSFPVHGLVEVGIGPVAGYLFAGPSMDMALSSDCSAEFCQFIREEKPMVVNASIGVGAVVDIPRSFRTFVEFRLSEGIGDAYVADGDSARNRTVEILVRLGRRF